MAIFGLHDAHPAPALAAYGRIGEAMAASRVRLTTNSRIIHSGDDSASVSAATAFQSQSATLRSTRVNGAKATSFLQVASNGLLQVREVLSGLGALVARANQSGLTDRDRTALDAQFQSALMQIDAVVARTTFNGARILDGSASGNGAPSYQLGYPAGSRLSLSIPDIGSTSLFPGVVVLSNSIGATAARASQTAAEATVANAIALVDAYQVRLDAADAVASRSIYGTENAVDVLIGTDAPAEARTLDRNRFQQETAATLLAQTFRFNSNLLTLVQTR